MGGVRGAGRYLPGTYRGLYCVGCEQFYTEEELDDGLCPEHRTPPEVIEEENYFFRLSRYAEPLLAAHRERPLAGLAAGRRNEVLSFLRGGLADLSISRSRRAPMAGASPCPATPTR